MLEFYCSLPFPNKLRFILNFQAAKCYRKASDLGNATAMYNLAVFYVHGWGGLKSNRQKAEELMQKAAALGEPKAKALCENRSKKTTPPISPEIIEKTYQLECKNEIQNVVNSLLKSTLDVYQLPYSSLDDCSDNSASTCSSISRNSVLFSEMDHSDSSASYYSGIIARFFCLFIFSRSQFLFQSQVFAMKMVLV